MIQKVNSISIISELALHPAVPGVAVMVWGAVVAWVCFDRLRQCCWFLVVLMIVVGY